MTYDLGVESLMYMGKKTRKLVAILNKNTVTSWGLLEQMTWGVADDLQNRYFLDPSSGGGGMCV